jgi:hypothetical protein
VVIDGVGQIFPVRRVTGTLVKERGMFVGHSIDYNFHLRETPSTIVNLYTLSGVNISVKKVILTYVKSSESAVFKGVIALSPRNCPAHLSQNLIVSLKIVDCGSRQHRKGSVKCTLQLSFLSGEVVAAMRGYKTKAEPSDIVVSEFLGGVPMNSLPDP